MLFNVLVLLAISLASGQETLKDPKTDSTTSLLTSAKLSSTSVSETTSEISRSTTETLASTSSDTPKTTFVPVSTKPPGPEEGSWNVTEGNVTCIRAELAIEFRIADRNVSIFLSPNAISNGSSCSLSNVTQSLVLEYENYILALEFEKDNTSTFVRNVSFSYTSVRTDVFYNDSKLFLVKNGNSYLCKTVDAISLGNATMHVFKVHIQAFGNAEEAGFGKSEECELDDSVSDVVPIAVACALAGLIIIVLIAYLIGRRRRQKGYTSV